MSADDAREELATVLLHALGATPLAPDVIDALLAHPDLVIAALGGELAGYDDPDLPGEYWPPPGRGGLVVTGLPLLYRFPVREGTDG